MELGVLQAVTDRFAAVLTGVTPDRYPEGTPCPDWTVVDLVDHVVAGNRWAALLLAGAEGRAARAEVQNLPKASDRRTDYPLSVTAQREAFEAAAPDFPVAHPFGPITAAQFLAMRTGDVLIHGWDLARALGVDDRIPPDLVAAGLAVFEPLAGWIASTGVFGTGAAGAPAPVDDQERLLQLTGRRP